jgi:hypothetical protein
MAETNRWHRKQAHELLELVVIHGSLPTSSVEPLQKDKDGLLHKVVNRRTIEGDTIVLNMTS